MQNSAIVETSKVSKIGAFYLDRVYLQDCIKAMCGIPTNSIDIAIADPPYNASKGGSWKWDNSKKLPSFGGDWSKIMVDWDDMSLSNYFKFTISWLTELKRIVKPTGSFWIHGTYHNIGIINFILQLLEIEIINEIIWYKRNSFPNLSQKPIRLLRRMFEISAKPGEILLVPFAGAGSDCVVAQELGVHFLGFELDKKFVELSNKRLTRG